MDKIKKMQAEMRHKEWIEAYEAYQLSGKTVKEWCAENYISIKTFYYRLRQVRKKAIEQIEQHEIVPIVASPELKPANIGKIRISGCGIEIELPSDIASDKLEAVIRGLRQC